MEPTVLGVLGGGQLGRMIASAAHDINIKTIVLDPLANCPASAVANEHIIGSFTDEAKIIELAKKCTILTVEIEHVNVDAIAKAAASTGVTVQPSASCVGLVQDKYAQKCAMRDGHVPLGDFRSVSSPADVSAAGCEWGYPLMLKSRMLAYDGRGNAVAKSAEGIQAAWDQLAAKGGLYVERWVPFVRELAVIVVRSKDGSCITYPTVQTVQRDNICHTVIAPAAIPATVQARAAEVAAQAIKLLDGAGVFGVELFELPEGGMYLNEIAPRVHNSGHFTIEGSVTSQFENHVRAVCGLPLGSTAMKTGSAVMLNILGRGSDAAAAEEMRSLCARALSTPGAALHWYGKADVKAQRKMGHVTVTGDRLQDVAGKVAYIAGTDLPELGPHGCVGAWSPSLALSRGPLAGCPALVGIIMGSDSDLPTMAPAAQILQEFGVPVEISIVSAHRTPERMYEYARSARSRGLRAIIAGAGGAAHLPGMVASLTCLPVIGVPVPLKHLDGMDSLYSILQMPKGIPVATVAIGNAANAGLLAARILGAAYPHLLDAVEAYAHKLQEEVQGKADKLEAIGWEQYLQTRK